LGRAGNHKTTALEKRKEESTLSVRFSRESAEIPHNTKSQIVPKVEVFPNLASSHLNVNSYQNQLIKEEPTLMFF